MVTYILRFYLQAPQPRIPNSATLMVLIKGIQLWYWLSLGIPSGEQLRAGACINTPQLPVPSLGPLIVILVPWVVVGTVSPASPFVPLFMTAHPLENIGSLRVPGVL